MDEDVCSHLTDEEAEVQFFSPLNQVDSERSCKTARSEGSYLPSLQMGRLILAKTSAGVSSSTGWAWFQTFQV